MWPRFRLHMDQASNLFFGPMFIFSTMVYEVTGRTHPHSVSTETQTSADGQVSKLTGEGAWNPTAANVPYPPDENTSVVNLPGETEILNITCASRFDWQRDLTSLWRYHHVLRKPLSLCIACNRELAQWITFTWNYVLMGADAKNRSPAGKTCCRWTGRDHTTPYRRWGNLLVHCHLY